MVHGPRGSGNISAPCMRDGKCSKGYPKQFQETTSNNDNGYPLYRRSKNAKSTEVKGVKLDNRWIVSYNPYLTLKYDAHINVEICSTVMAVKYLYKYVYKGHDKALLEIKNNESDEIAQYVDGRYLSATEACWRIFCYSMHKEFPNVIRLAVHLPDRQIFCFKKEQDLTKLKKKKI